MSEKPKVLTKPNSIRLFNLLEEIAMGNISLPAFGRVFVWSQERMIDLFDSINKGYPIGSFVFCNPQNHFEMISKIGPYEVSMSKKTHYVLDGAQRITTLYGVLTNPKKFNKSENDIKDFLIYYNVETKEFSFLKENKPITMPCIALYRIADTFEYLDFIQEIRSSTLNKNQQLKFIDNAREINKRFLEYVIPYIEIIGADMQNTIEIFSRINSSGMPLSADAMLSTITYKQESAFLLSDSITIFLNKLGVYNFSGLKRNIIINCIANAQGKIYFDVAIEDLKKLDLEALTQKVYVYIEKAIQFLYNRLFIFDILLLPYSLQLIFISEFFRLNPSPKKNDLKKLENWFWFTAYVKYFTIYTLSQQRNAYKIFCEFAIRQHEDGIFKLPNMQFETSNYPTKLNITAVRAKTLQLFYLKSIAPAEIQLSESIKEFFIDPTSKKDRSPANILLRLASEFEVDKKKKTPDSFIKNSSLAVLEQHFITKEMLDLYKQGKIEDFLQKREDYMKEKEKAFVEQWDIKYII